MDKLAEWFRTWFANKPPERESLVLESNGLAFERAGNRTFLKWADVIEVFAYKADLLSVDLICIGFRISNDGRCVEIDEQMPGYAAVVEALPAIFPGIRTDWWQAVAFPAFELNSRSLWGKQKMR